MERLFIRHHRMRGFFVLLLLLVIRPESSFGQVELSPEIALPDRQFSQQLLNGRYYLDEENVESGNAFLYPEFQSGEIVIRNRRFKEVLLKYDLYKQIVILQSQSAALPVKIVLPNEFIEEFSIGDFSFRMKTKDDGERKILQLLGDPESFTFYRYLSKNRFESIDQNRRSSYKYAKLRQTSYISYENRLYPLKSPKDLQHILPTDIADTLQIYLKSRKIKFRKTSDQELLQIAAFINLRLKEFYPEATYVPPQEPENTTETASESIITAYDVAPLVEEKKIDSLKALNEVIHTLQVSQNLLL